MKGPSGPEAPVNGPARVWARTPLRGWLSHWLGRWLDPQYAWKRFVHNLGPKLLALLVAVGLWLMATAERRANVEQGYDVPVTVVDTTGGAVRRTTSTLNPPTVRVTLSGLPQRLRQLSGKSIQAVVDVTGVPEGSFTRTVRVVPPTGTRVSRQEPERVQGFVDTQLIRTLPVTLSVATPSETSLPRFAVTPAEASVSGPARVVGTVRQVVTSPATLTAGTEREVPLIALNAAGQPVVGVETRPATVTLRRLDTGELPVKALPVVLNAPPPGLKVTSVSVQPGTVRVVASPDLLGRLREIGGSVEYRAGTYTAPVTLRLPAGTQALEDVNVRLTVESQPATPAPAAPAQPSAPAKADAPAQAETPAQP